MSSFPLICLRGERRDGAANASLPADLAGDFALYEDESPLLTGRLFFAVAACCSSELDSLSAILCPARLTCALTLCVDLCVDLGVMSVADAALVSLGLSCVEARAAFFPRAFSSLEVSLVSLELVLPDFVMLCALIPLLEALTFFLKL